MTGLSSVTATVSPMVGTKPSRLWHIIVRLRLNNSLLLCVLCWLQAVATWCADATSPEQQGAIILPGEACCCCCIEGTKGSDMLMLKSQLNLRAICCAAAALAVLSTLSSCLPMLS
jgi:hypothetical protein